MAQLEALADCPLAGECLHIKAQLPHTVKSVQVDRPIFGLVLHGAKRLSTTRQTVQLQAGDVFLVTGRCHIDAHNAPDPVSQRYLAITLNLCDEVLHAARILWAQPLRSDDTQLIALPADSLADALHAWSNALRQGHYEQARAALVQMVIWLCRQGHHALLAPPPPRLADSVRQLVAAAPARPWLSRDVETALHLSGASLRRHLAAEGTSLSQVLRDARMGHALELLYTTALPIKAVAARAGYQSVQSFSRQFEARYQLRPADIGNH
ncbi:helix-turn-helix transcriptional regulator [Comamonas sp. 4034]|uniref:helix-turn-helix transcriptional regulator n=1 Tax=Comamonas sp. 4034 TaxID=3156455 RepID=UPI003D1BC669